MCLPGLAPAIYGSIGDAVFSAGSCAISLLAEPRNSNSGLSDGSTFLAHPRH